MKTLYTICFALIGVLVFAAFNPKEVVRTAKKVQYKLVEEPREIAQMEKLLAGVEAGNPDDMYTLGWSKAAGNMHIPYWQPDMVAHLTAEDGERLLREAAAKGHIDARYWVWKTDGGTEEEFMELLEGGAVFARMRVLSNVYDNYCDTSWDAHFEVVRAQFHDIESPVWDQVRTAQDFTEENFRKISAEFDQRAQGIEAARANGCPAE